MKEKGTTTSSFSSIANDCPPVTITFDSMEGDDAIIEVLLGKFDFLSKPNFFNLSTYHYLFVRKYVLLWFG